jgi:hypothetical protein
MASGDRHDSAAYPLRLVQKLVREGRYRLRMRAADDAARLGLLDAVVACVCALLPESIRDGGNFHKSMLARRPPPVARGLWQDVYLTEWDGERLYVKVQIGRDGNVAIISFHENDGGEKSTTRGN